MVALGDWGLVHRQGERRLRVRAELLRDGGPELVAAMIDEVPEIHLGAPRPDPDAPRTNYQLRAAYEAALLRRDDCPRRDHASATSRGQGTRMALDTGSSPTRDVGADMAQIWSMSASPFRQCTRLQPLAALLPCRGTKIGA